MKQTKQDKAECYIRVDLRRERGCGCGCMNKTGQGQIFKIFSYLEKSLDASFSLDLGGGEGEGKGGERRLAGIKNLEM